MRKYNIFSTIMIESTNIFCPLTFHPPNQIELKRYTRNAYITFSFKARCMQCKGIVAARCCVVPFHQKKKKKKMLCSS